MAVYVDDYRRFHQVGRTKARWSHLMADTDAELHEFASKLGLRRNWFQHAGKARSHYDVTERVRANAIALGAKEIAYGGEQQRRLLRERQERIKEGKPL